MKLGRILLVGAALLLCGVPMAQAGTKIIATPPVPNTIPLPGRLYCDIVNLNTTPKDVTTEIVDINGNVVFGPITDNLPPGVGTAYVDFGGGGAWCKWTVNGSTKKYRGLGAYDDGSSYSITVPGY